MLLAADLVFIGYIFIKMSHPTPTYREVEKGERASLLMMMSGTKKETRNLLFAPEPSESYKESKFYEDVEQAQKQSIPAEVNISTS